MVDSRTAFEPATGTTGITATASYSFAGKTIAERTAASGVQKLTFIISDSVNTSQTLVEPTDGTTGVIAVTRFMDPRGLSRGPTLTAKVAAAVTGLGSNAANPTGFSAANGYIGGLADIASTLTHLGARDLDLALGIFTAPDPVLDNSTPRSFSPFLYSGGDPINGLDPSGLMVEISDGGNSWHGAKAHVGVPNSFVSWAPPYATGVMGIQVQTQADAQQHAQTLDQVVHAQQAPYWSAIGSGITLIAGAGLSVVTGGASIAAAGSVVAPETAAIAYAAAGTGGALLTATVDAADNAEVEAEEAKGGVYTLQDGSGNVVRTGRTNDFERRRREHSNDPVLSRFTFRKEYFTDSLPAQRGLEQVLYDRYPEAQYVNGGYNKRRGVSLTNSKASIYAQAAQKYFTSRGIK